MCASERATDGAERVVRNDIWFLTYMKHITSFCIKWLPPQKKQQQQHREWSVCFTEKEGMKGGVAKTGTKKDFAKKASLREPAERREPLIFFLFLHFLFLGSKETVGTTTPHTQDFLHTEKENKAQSTNAHKTPQLCQQNLWTLLPISRD